MLIDLGWAGSRGLARRPASRSAAAMPRAGPLWHSPRWRRRSTAVGRTAIADLPCCSSSNVVASRPKLILGGESRGARPRSAARRRSKVRV